MLQNKDNMLYYLLYILYKDNIYFILHFYMGTDTIKISCIFRVMCTVNITLLKTSIKQSETTAAGAWTAVERVREQERLCCS